MEPHKKVEPTVTGNEMSFQMYRWLGSWFFNVWKGGGLGCALILGLVNKVTWKMFFLSPWWVDQR